jgi:hypothetical protein
MRFRGLLELGGKTATGMRVPDEVIAGLGGGKRPPVSVTINGYTYRTGIGVMGGVCMLPVSAEVRSKAGVSAGQELDVDIELDTAPREVSVPADFQAALDADGDAKRAFEGMSYSNRLRLVLAIDAAKAAETRQRRIATTIERLRAGTA